MIQRGLGAGMGFIGAIAESHQPVARVAQVVVNFLQRPGSDGGQLCIGRSLQALPNQHHQGTVEEVAHDRRGVVAIRAGRSGQGRGVWQLHQGVVAKIGDVAEVRQAVLGRTLALLLGCVLVQQPGLADQVQAVVGHGQIFLDDGAMSAPFGVALTEDQGVVGQVQQVVRRCGGYGSAGVHHMCPTSSGIS